MWNPLASESEDSMIDINGTLNESGILTIFRTDGDQVQITVSATEANVWRNKARYAVEIEGAYRPVYCKNGRFYYWANE